MKKTLSSFITAVALCASTCATEGSATTLGILNYHVLAADSKLGKQERSSFEAIRNQMVSIQEETRKQWDEINSKLKDPEFVDSLSPEAKAEHETKMHNLEMEMQRYANQFAQVSEQAQMRYMQSLMQNINVASDTVRKNKSLTLIVNKEACPSSDDSLDVTPLVLVEMDKNFDEAQKKLAANAEAAEAKQTPADNPVETTK